MPSLTGLEGFAPFSHELTSWEKLAGDARRTRLESSRCGRRAQLCRARTHPRTSQMNSFRWVLGLGFRDLLIVHEQCSWTHSFDRNRRGNGVVARVCKARCHRSYFRLGRTGVRSGCRGPLSPISSLAFDGFQQSFENFIPFCRLSIPFISPSFPSFGSDLFQFLAKELIILVFITRVKLSLLRA